MATLYEYYNTGGVSYDLDFYAAGWRAQTFTPSTTHKVTSVKLLLGRYGSPGTVTVSIRATSGGHPTGADLCSGATDGNTLPTGSPWEWRQITLGAGYDLSAGVKYAIVVRAPSGSYYHRLFWLQDSDEPTYSGGNYESSSDSGSSWTSQNTVDFMFEEWGELAVTAKTSSDTGSGVDAYVSLETGEVKLSSDTGSGVDVTPMPSAILASSETGSSIDALIARLLTAVDGGTDTEVSSLFTDSLQDLFANELGWGADSLTAKIEMPTKGGGMKLWT